MIHVSFTNLRKRLAHFMDRAVDDRAPVLVTRQGHEPVVMMAQADYESMMRSLQSVGPPSESAEAFLKRMRSNGPLGDDVIDEMEAAIRELHVPYRGVEL